MEWTGLALLLLVGIGIVSTGLPAAFILIGVATLGALLGVATGTIPLSLLSALPGRLINLFENDLLQALPLYVTMGLLLDRLPVADALYRTSIAILPKRASAPLVSGMVLGALLGPMNGSVGASVLGLSRVVAPRLTARRRAGGDARRHHRGRQHARRAGAAVAGADPAQRRDAVGAHHRGDGDRPQRPRHQHAGYLPCRAGAGRHLPAALPRARLARRPQPGVPSTPRERSTPRQTGRWPRFALVALLVLLGGVATGYFYAVEAAAMGAFALLAAG